MDNTMITYKSTRNCLKGTRHVHNIFSNLFFQPPRYEEFSSNNFKILYCPNITTMVSTASLVVWSRHLAVNHNEKILGSNPTVYTDLFFNKALYHVYYVMLHFYLQQPGIIKMFLLCNIPGKVPQFFLYKQDIMRVNCMQNFTKYYWRTLRLSLIGVLQREQFGFAEMKWGKVILVKSK
jgi:hypothetical protein